MIGTNSGANAGVIWAVYLALMLFAIGYNEMVKYAARRGWTIGYISIFVVVGVLVTLAGVAVVDFDAALITLGAFAASGAPMVAGSIYRHMIYREADIESLRQEVMSDKSKGMAQ